MTINSSTTIPLVDLAFQHHAIAEVLERDIIEACRHGDYIAGAAVRDFEDAFARYCDVSHCIGVANGTDAIELALRALGLDSGDKVLVPANSFVASAEAVVRAGAVPVFVDCDPVTLLIDRRDLNRQLDIHRPRAILPVHLYGQIAPMDDVVDLAIQYGAYVIEDAAQAQGARQNGKAIGAWGKLAATSFYPGKNLGAYGDAGAVLTTDRELDARVRLLANHGSRVRYQHEIVGFNSRLDTLQALVLAHKLRHLTEWNALRQAAACEYQRLLQGVPHIACPTVAPGNEHVWHLYVVRVAQRDRVLAALHEKGIGAGIHYPVPIHLQPAFASHGGKLGDFPNAEAASSEILSLPIYPGITRIQQLHIVEALGEATR